MVAEWASRYIGIPFKMHGADRTGIDCWNLFRLIYQEQFDRKLPSYNDEYDESFNREQLAAVIYRHLAPWSRIMEQGKESPGDAILFRILGEPTHVAVVAGDGFMVHVMRGCNSVLEHYRQAIWAHRIVGFYRYVG